MFVSPKWIRIQESVPSLTHALIVGGVVEPQHGAYGPVAEAEVGELDPSDTYDRPHWQDPAD